MKKKKLKKAFILTLRDLAKDTIMTAVMLVKKVVILFVVINARRAFICNASKFLLFILESNTQTPLTCSDPPLEESDIPTGEWLCHNCKCQKLNQPQVRNKRSASSSSGSSTKSVKKAKTSAMDLLIKAASMLNPKQFELPYYMHEPCNFPGTDKSM